MPEAVVVVDLSGSDSCCDAVRVVLGVWVAGELNVQSVSPRRAADILYQLSGAGAVEMVIGDV